jgi:hypothetical protein
MLTDTLARIELQRAYRSNRVMSNVGLTKWAGSKFRNNSWRGRTSLRYSVHAGWRNGLNELRPPAEGTSHF